MRVETPFVKHLERKPILPSALSMSLPKVGLLVHQNVPFNEQFRQSYQKPISPASLFRAKCKMAMPRAPKNSCSKRPRITISRQLAHESHGKLMSMACSRPYRILSIHHEVCVSFRLHQKEIWAKRLRIGMRMDSKVIEVLKQEILEMSPGNDGDLGFGDEIAVQNSLAFQEEPVT